MQKRLQRDLNVLRYEDAAVVLPLRLRKAAMALPATQKAVAEEFRLRAGRAMTVLLPEGERALGSLIVQRQDLERLMEICSSASPMQRLRVCGWDLSP